jgi:carboxymethylenebutenolidase
MRESITIRTQDGNCPATVFRPETAGSFPAVIFYMDGLGIRPALLDMAERLARCGYVVLLPDLYYRFGPYAPMDPKVVLGDPENRKVMIAPKIATTGNQPAAADTAAFIAYLDTRSDIAGRKIGTTGYCMGGGISLTAAGTYPERIAAAASFHGGNLATDLPVSPHLLAPKMKAEIYVGGADQDASYPPEMAARLEKALVEAHVAHRCEIYAGALHGWTMTDFAIYNQAAAERHWTELTALFQRALF